METVRSRFDIETVRALIKEHAHWDRIEQMSDEAFAAEWEIDADPNVPGFEDAAHDARENELENTIQRVFELTGWTEDECSMWLCGGPITAAEEIDLAVQTTVSAVKAQRRRG